MKRIKIKFQNVLLIISIILVITILLVMSLRVHFENKRFIMDNIEKTNIDNLLQAKKRLEYNLNQIQSITMYISKDEIIKEYLRQQNDLEISKQMTLEEINSYLERMKKLNPLIKTIVLFTENITYKTIGDFIYYNADYSIIEEFTDSNQNKNNDNINIAPTLHTPSNITNIEESSDFIDYLSKNFFLVRDISKDDYEYGTILTVINSNFFQELFSTNKNIVVCNSKDEILWKSSEVENKGINNIIDKIDWEQSESTKKIKVDNYNYYISSIDEYDIKIAYIHDSTDISKRLKPFRIFTIILSFILIIFSIFLSKVVSKKITFPIIRLVKIVSKVKLFDKSNRKNEFNKKQPFIHEIVFFYFMFTLIIPVIIFSITSYFYSKQYVSSYILQSKKAVFMETKENIEQFLDSKVKIVKNISYNSITQKFLLEEDNSSKMSLQKIVKSSIKLDQGMNEVNIYDISSEKVYSNTDTVISELESLISYFSKKEEILSWIGIVNDEYSRKLFALRFIIKDIENYKNIGYLFYFVPEYELEKIYTSIESEEASVFIASKDGKIISHRDKELIDTYFDDSNSNKNVLIKKQIKNTDFYLYDKYSNTIYAKNNSIILNKRIYDLIIIIFIAMFLSTLLSTYLTSSFRRISVLLKKVGLDNIDIIFSEKDHITEIQELGKAFNKMVVRIESLIDQLIISKSKQYQMENKKKEAEIKALQMQINPHFLYNTFESINWLIERNKKSGAIKMMSDLSDLLRYTANTDKKIININDELKHVKHYTEIMRCRFNQKINFYFNIDESLLDYKTLKLILQPIVENAVYHGLETVKSDGQIKITCKKNKDSICFIIEDNGDGISKEKLREIRGNLLDEDYHGNIGLYNVQNRIRLFFGDKYGVNIESKYLEGTIVKISIPIIETENSSSEV